MSHEKGLSYLLVAAIALIPGMAAAIGAFKCTHLQEVAIPVGAATWALIVFGWVQIVKGRE